MRCKVSGNASALIKPAAPGGQTGYISEEVATQDLGHAPTREVTYRARLGKLACAAIYSLGSVQDSAERTAAAIAATAASHDRKPFPLSQLSGQPQLRWLEETNPAASAENKKAELRIL